MKAEESILKHIGLAGVLKGYGIYDNVITAMEDYKKEDSLGKIKELQNNVSEDSCCPDWIHEERVKLNDDNYCPICGKKLQSKIKQQ